MNGRTRLAMALVTGGALAVGTVALAAPAIAGTGVFSGPAAAAGNGNGQGMRDGSCLSPSATAPAETLTDQTGTLLGQAGTPTGQQEATLAAVAEEEKLAGDLYQAFADRYPDAIFYRIAAAEDQHLQAVRTVLARYEVTDPTADMPAGQFADQGVQATYDQLLAQGVTGSSAALEVGQQVEKADIATLEAALDGLSAADVTQL